MTTPALFLALLISSLSALLFHLWRGGRLRRLAAFLLAAWLSFAAGQLVGEWLGLRFFRLGTLNLFSALLACFIGLFLTDWLLGPDRGLPPPRRRRPPIAGPGPGL